VALPEWRCTLVRHSCTIRKTEVSTSGGSRPRSLGASSVVAIPLRYWNPFTYQRSVVTSPASSITGGCSR
jgi:hypothetical protein